jgi:hypothetical protein
MSSPPRLSSSMQKSPVQRISRVLVLVVVILCVLSCVLVFLIPPGSLSVDLVYQGF